MLERICMTLHSRQDAMAGESFDDRHGRSKVAMISNDAD